MEHRLENFVHKEDQSRKKDSYISDPESLDVKQKVLHFETLQAEEKIMTTERLLSHQVLKNADCKHSETIDLKRNKLHITFLKNQYKERSENENFSDFTDNVCDGNINNGDGFIKIKGIQKTEELKDNSLYVTLSSKEINISSCSNNTFSKRSEEAKPITNFNKDFPRNFRSRPKTELIGSKNDSLIGKCPSLYLPKPHHEPEEEAELRNKSTKITHPILEELINTEETYVDNLFNGILNYGAIFQRKDLPLGLRGKKFVLLGNIEQIAEFHRNEFLPMLHHNRHDLQRLFEEFQSFIENNCFYAYVIFTMNKQRSLKLCDAYKNYFKLIQLELDDKLGINSFLVQPIQRMARYPLLLQQFISTLFKNRDYIMKPTIEACCRLEKRMRTLLTATNESEIVNDITDCNDFNVLYQGKFRKVNEFHVFDHTLKRSYRSKVFIFDKCIINTEIKGKSLLFHGRYPCEYVGIVAKAKYITLFYQRRKQQECDFHADPVQIDSWLELIRDMLNTFAAEERLKLHERYSRENYHLHHKVPSLSLFRDSNRFSTDSGISVGIGNVWVMPKPEIDHVAPNGNRTTWYYNSNSISPT